MVPRWAECMVTVFSRWNVWVGARVAAQSDAPLVKAIVVLDGTGRRVCAKYYAKAEFPSKAKQVPPLLCTACVAASCVRCAGAAGWRGGAVVCVAARAADAQPWLHGGPVWWCACCARARAQLEFEETLHKKAKVTASSRMDCEVATLDPYVCVYRTGSNITFFVLGAADEVRARRRLPRGWAAWARLPVPRPPVPRCGCWLAGPCAFVMFAVGGVERRAASCVWWAPTASPLWKGVRTGLTVCRERGPLRSLRCATPSCAASVAPAVPAVYMHRTSSYCQRWRTACTTPSLPC